MMSVMPKKELGDRHLQRYPNSLTSLFLPLAFSVLAPLKVLFLTPFFDGETFVTL
jgi:hypothetical protein